MLVLMRELGAAMPTQSWEKQLFCLFLIRCVLWMLNEILSFDIIDAPSPVGLWECDIWQNPVCGHFSYTHPRSLNFFSGWVLACNSDGQHGMKALSTAEEEAGSVMSKCVRKSVSVDFHTNFSMWAKHESFYEILESAHTNGWTALCLICIIACLI